MILLAGCILGAVSASAGYKKRGLENPLTDPILMAMMVSATRAETVLGPLLETSGRTRRRLPATLITIEELNKFEGLLKNAGLVVTKAKLFSLFQKYTSAAADRKDTLLQEMVESSFEKLWLKNEGMPDFFKNLESDNSMAASQCEDAVKTQIKSSYEQFKAAAEKRCASDPNPLTFEQWFEEAEAEKQLDPLDPTQFNATCDGLDKAEAAKHTLHMIGTQPKLFPGLNLDPASRRRKRKSTPETITT